MKQIHFGDYYLRFNKHWRWWSFNISLRGKPSEQDILTYTMTSPIPWWFRVGPFSLSWRWK